MGEAEGEAYGCFAQRAERIASSPSISEKVNDVERRVRQAGPALVNRAPRGSRPCGFDPRADSELLAGGARAKGPPLCGVVITARRAGALLTGLATALAVGARRSGVAITAPKAGAILPPPLRFGRPFAGPRWRDAWCNDVGLLQHPSCSTSRAQTPIAALSSAAGDQGMHG